MTDLEIYIPTVRESTPCTRSCLDKSNAQHLRVRSLLLTLPISSAIF
jgi:hypothetical protein